MGPNRQASWFTQSHVCPPQVPRVGKAQKPWLVRGLVQGNIRHCSQTSIIVSYTHTYRQVYFAEMCFSSVQSLSHVGLFVTKWTAARQASLSITNSQRLLKLMSIQSVMPSNHLILCRPLLLLPSIFLSIRVFSNQSAPRIRWLKYRSFSFSISPSIEYSGLISFSMD